jgi:CelD/BcsL family acetyltransferase involved in cellulose biosynthesis
VSSAGGTGGTFLLEVNDQPPPDWDELQAADPDCEYSQTRYWCQTVAAEVPAAGGVWLTARRAGRLVAGLSAVTRHVRRPVLGLPVAFDRCDASFEGTSGGPLFAPALDTPQRKELFGLLVDRLGRLRHGVLGSCALVLSPGQERDFRPLMSGRRGWVRHDALTAAVPLAGGIEEVAKTRMVTNKRNERNRAQRRGVEHFITTDRALVAEYYPIYEEAARHWGVAPPPLGLLQALVADPGGGVFFTCVRLEGKVIGGHLNLHHGERVLVWNGVTDPAYARDYFPATMCMWGDLEEACRRGAAWLDMGGSAGVDTLQGFKRFFGAELQMRGLYFHDAPTAALAKRTRGYLGRLRRGGTAGRWHDRVRP